VDSFTAGFAGRVAGFVVHDKKGMDRAVTDVVAAMRSLGHADRPPIFLEYAAGMEPALFLEIGGRLRNDDGVGLCTANHVLATEALDVTAPTSRSSAQA
jgi:hypothetical protein